MSAPTSPLSETGPTVQEQAPTLLGAIAGYVGHRTVAMGLRQGLIAELARHERRRIDELAAARGLDPYLVAVWCRAALATGVCERAEDGYRLAPHMATLLLDQSSPAYVGSVFTVLEQPEVFDRFEEALATGDRFWWDDLGPEWIAGVARTGTPFYTRLIPDGLARVDGLRERLEAGARVVDTACGAGEGLVKLATSFPRSEVVGIDGDPYSIDRARQRLSEAGLLDRVELAVQPLEGLSLDQPATVLVNNISMHECRDLDRATRRLRDALEPGGWLVISDFPFPESDEGLASTPGRIMSGIQFFEAMIDDQLLPRSAYDRLLADHGFVELGSAELTPLHALTWGRRP